MQSLESLELRIADAEVREQPPFVSILMSPLVHDKPANPHNSVIYVLMFLYMLAWG